MVYAVGSNGIIWDPTVGIVTGVSYTLSPMWLTGSGLFTNAAQHNAGTVGSLHGEPKPGCT